MPESIPFEIRESIVEVCGRAFWLKDKLRNFLTSAGVPAALYDKYAAEPKFKIARSLLADLEAMGDEGYLIQRRIVTELCKLRHIPDETVVDKDAAYSALRKLKELAIEHDLAIQQHTKEIRERAYDRQRLLEDKQRQIQRLAELQQRLGMMTRQEDAQARGYDLQKLFEELFEVFGIEYRPPYRTPTEEIDGHFMFEDHDYLVELRWRKDPPSEQDLAAFKYKVDKKISGTRGVFVSMVGFRLQTVDEFNKGAGTNIILMDGNDLALILEGHISLPDALRSKVRKAAQEGLIYWPLSAAL